MDTITLLQHYWWLVISLLGALLVFLMFVQGGQALLYTIGRTEEERNMLVNSLGRKWEFTTLVTFGGAFFASFPLFYSTSFGGAFYVWMAILLCFVIQAVAYEYRRKPGNVFGERTFNAFLLVNGVLGPLLIGTAVGTFFTGAEFTVDRLNLANQGGAAVISQWATPWHGLEAVAEWRNVLLGLSVTLLAMTLACQYFMNNIDDEAIFVGEKYHFEVTVDIANLRPEDIGVEMVIAQQIVGGGKVNVTRTIGLKHTKTDGSRVTYALDYVPGEAGTFDVALRIYPSNPLLPHRMDFALVKWA